MRLPLSADGIIGKPKLSSHKPRPAGKSAVAKAIHAMSNRANGPFIEVNCAVLHENLIESELFGYEKGAFTGAASGGKIGKIELANHGTLFLDTGDPMAYLLFRSGETGD